MSAALGKKLAAQPQRVTDTQALKFNLQGFITVQNLLPKDTVTAVQKAVKASLQTKRLAALQHRVRVLCPGVSRMPDTEEHALSLLRRHGTDTVGFLQFFNSWETDEVVRSLVQSELLAGTAAQLLGVPRLRLYQDCVFYKEPGFSETNWHSDLRMTPLDTNDFITAWIPLRPIRSESSPAKPVAGSGGQQGAGGGRGPRGRAAVPSVAQHALSTLQQEQQQQRRQLQSQSQSKESISQQHIPQQQHTQQQQGQETGSKQSQQQQHRLRGPSDLPDSGLLFAAGSHRDFALPYWYDVSAMDLTGRYKLASTGSMELGDVSFHHGWTVHAAGPQQRGSEPRTALAISYFADGAKLRRRQGHALRATFKEGMPGMTGIDEDMESYERWMRDLKDGAAARHALLPLVYP